MVPHRYFFYILSLFFILILLFYLFIQGWRDEHHHEAEIIIKEFRSKYFNFFSLSLSLCSLSLCSLRLIIFCGKTVNHHLRCHSFDDPVCVCVGSSSSSDSDDEGKSSRFSRSTSSMVIDITGLLTYS